MNEFVEKNETQTPLFEYQSKIAEHDFVKHMKLDYTINE